MSLERLVELQGIDTQLKDLSDLLGDLPSKVQGLNDQENAIKNSLAENKKRLKELDVELHKREVDVSQVDTKVNNLKDQLFLVTNNKQYDALMNEIDHLKDKKSNFENEAIEFLEEKEQSISKVESMENELKDLSSDLSQRKEKLEFVIAESAEKKSDLEKARQAKIDDIGLSLVSAYDKVRDHRNGLAVVPLVGSGCGGCGAHIPPQTQTEIRANKGIHRCGVCLRFLYYHKEVVN